MHFLQRRILGNSPVAISYNGVRHIPQYKGSLDAESLLDLYVGDKNYRKISRYLRAPTHQDGINEVIKEAIATDSINKPISYNQAYNDFYSPLIKNKITSSFKYNPNEIKQILSEQKIGSSLLQYLNDDPKLGYLASHVSETLGYGNNELATIKALETISNSPNIHSLTKQVAKLKESQGNYSSLREEANQVVASIPHLNEVLKQQTVFQADNSNLLRGLHFSNPEKAQVFLEQHQPGNIVEYPSFTSFTFDRKISDGFSNERKDEIPINIEMIPNKNGFSNAYDVNNAAESEFIMPLNSRVKVLSNEPLLNGGAKIIVEDATGQVTPVEEHTQQILGRLKPKIATII